MGRDRKRARFHVRLINSGALIAILAGFTVWPLLIWSRFHWYVGAYGMVGVIWALGVNLLFGHCGQIHFGAAGFVAIGGYTMALLQTKFGANYLLLNLVLAGLVSGLAGAMLGWPLIRLHGHTLALGTFVVFYGIYLLSESWVGFTGGGDGMRVLVPSLFGHGLRNTPIIYYLALITAVLGFLFCHTLTSSKVGRALHTIKFDETVAATVGIPVMRYKWFTFILSSIFLGLGGALWAIASGFIGPDFFSFRTNIGIVIMVVLGGLGNNLGAVIGGLILTVFPELMYSAKEYNELVFASLLLLIIVTLPEGLSKPLQGAWSKIVKASEN